MQNQRTVKRPTFACLGVLGTARLPRAMSQVGCCRRQRTLAACKSLYRLSSFVFVNLLSLIPTIFPNKYSLVSRISRAQRFRGSLCYVVGDGALVFKRRATAGALAWRARLWPMPASRYLQNLRTRQGQSAGAMIRSLQAAAAATDAPLC
jgi:hypothetical protein